MRTTFLLLLLSLGAGGAMLVNARRTQTPPNSVASESAPVAAPKVAVSQHNWPKHALDRTAEMKRQVADQRKQDDAN